MTSPHENRSAVDGLAERILRLSPKQLAVLALELKDRLERAEAARNEPIAIVGVGCRLPGGCDDPDRYWTLLRDGSSGICEVPGERWPIDAYYDPEPTAPAKIVCRYGGFLGPVDGFDAEFFSIPEAEAAAMDPQQRLLLEMSWEALERSGQPVDELAGSATGVFVGVSSHDYADLKLRLGGARAIDEHYGTGNAASLVAGRLSYVLGLQGPAIVVDTACSSSLVAVHLACQSLRQRECDLALAGGVHLMLSPETSIFLSKARVLARDGKCKAFDAKADGYVRGEGGGVVVLQRLSDALSRRAPIVAVIRGSMICQDGRSNGLRAPNGAALESLMERCLRESGVQASEIDYVEAHGTGTLLGDMIEANALGRVLGGAERPRPCMIGSVKTNIGHLEAAAGIASLIKVALALKNRQVPPSLNFETPNPHVPFSTLSLSVATQLSPWPSAGRPARAAVDALSWSGTNAHAILEEAPSAAPLPSQPAGPELLVLSARSPAALAELARAVMDLSPGPGVDERAWLHQLCATAATRRGHQAIRLALVCSSRADLTHGLGAFLRGEPRPGMTHGRRPANRRPTLAWLFGASFPAAVADHCFSAVEAFAEREPAFGRAYRETAAALGLMPWHARSSEGKETAEDVARRQVALQIGLAALCRAWALMPQAALGFGAGEVAAACAAGILSAKDAALALSSQRGAQPAEAVVADVIVPQAGDIALYSSRTGELIDGARFDARSFLQRSPAAAEHTAEIVSKLSARSPVLLLQMGPTSADGAALAQPRCEVISLLGDAAAPPPGPDTIRATLLAAVGRLYAVGCGVDRPAVYRDPVVPAALPTYPWQRRRCWIDGVNVEDARK